MTDDLPTPPLPDEISKHRVRDSGSANGIALPSACPCAGCDPAVAAASPWSRSRSSARSSSVMTVKSRDTDETPSSGTDGAFDAVRDLVAQRAAGHRERDQHGHAAVVDRDVAHHAEIDDRAMQLGVLDGPQRLEDLLVRAAFGRLRHQEDLHYADR